MKYAYLENNTVGELVGNDPFQLFQPPYAEQFIEVPEEVQIGWYFDGYAWNAPFVPMIKTQADLEGEIQRQLNAFAQEKDFDSIEDACNWINSTVDEWASESRRAIEVRDIAWKTFKDTGEIVILGWDI
jgi:hypothetical protein